MENEENLKCEESEQGDQQDSLASATEIPTEKLLSAQNSINYFSPPSTSLCGALKDSTSFIYKTRNTFSYCCIIV